MGVRSLFSALEEAKTPDFQTRQPPLDCKLTKTIEKFNSKFAKKFVREKTRSFQPDTSYGINFNSPEPSFYDDASTLDEPPNLLYPYGSGTFGAAYFSDRLFGDDVREFAIFIRPHIFETEPVPRFRLVISSLSEELVLRDRSFTLQDEYLFGSDPLFGNPDTMYHSLIWDGRCAH